MISKNKKKLKKRYFDSQLNDKLTLEPQSKAKSLKFDFN